MRKEKAGRRDVSALEKRRMMAVRLLHAGVSESEVARQLGVHRQSVNRWARSLKRGGERALRAKRAGRPGRLHTEDLKRLEGRLKRGSGWTAKRVAALIERECRVRYDPSQAWRILRRLGWSWRAGGGWKL